MVSKLQARAMNRGAPMKNASICIESEEELGEFACFRCGKSLNSATIVFIWGYEMWVHMACFDESEQGWTLGEERIREHLRKCYIEVPPRNAQGWLPRDYPPQLGHRIFPDPF